MSMVLKGIHHQLSTGGITKMLFKLSGQDTGQHRTFIPPYRKSRLAI
ncbi:MAG: hypothetical protein ACJAV1_000716 [Paraglaciecola sp.]|jgi:hypothetical protein